MRSQPGFWRKCRVGFRWCRITVLLLVLALVCVFVWLNRIGLPDFLKTRLVEKLHSRGVDLEFSRMRLRVVRGLVIENVRIGDAKIPDSPTLAVQEIQLRVNFPALLHRRLELNGLVLRQGKVAWAFSPTNTLALDDIQTDLRFQTNETWSLDNFQAGFAGAKLSLSGDVAHAPEIRNWKVFRGGKTGGVLKEQLKKISETLGQIHFVGEPQLSVNITGDARDPQTFSAHLALTQARTQLKFDGVGFDSAENFQWRVYGTVEPEIIRPFLKTNALRALNRFTFAEPIAVDVNVRGRLNDYDSLGANGQIALTNFTVRGQLFGSVASELFYTNRVLEFFHPHLARENGEQTMTADKVTLNFNEQMIYFTNGFSTADPLPIARAIGPKIGRIIEPYRFLSPPTARVNGHVSTRDVNKLHDIDDADMRFDVIEPARFQWLKLETPGIKGTIHWLGETLILTNVTAPFYGGSGNGFAFFDFSPPHPGADYQFTVQVSNVNLHTFAVAMSTPKNHLEGALSGKVIVTHADTRDWRTWDGFGHANLHDGLLWDIPVFGFLSPILNMVSPGLGNSRATDASARFTITNGVIYTDSMEIHTVMARLKYNGTVDLKQNVDARVTADLLRETPVIGSVISTILWPVGKLFEYKITGTLEHPKSEPVYVPKILLMPFHPIRSIEELLPGGDNFPNAPPGK